jgi:flagellar motor switch/type III secretory pathway protein FliN
MDTSLAVRTEAAGTEEHEWELVASLPVSLCVAIRVKQFTVRDLLLLEVGTVVETSDPATNTVPLVANGKRIGKGMFEAVGQHIGLRVSELGRGEQERAPHA